MLHRADICTQKENQISFALQNGEAIITDINIRNNQLIKGTITLQIYRYHCINSILQTKKLRLSDQNIQEIISHITEKFQASINNQLQRKGKDQCICYEISMNNKGTLWMRETRDSGNEITYNDVSFNSQEVIETELNKYLETKTTNNKDKPPKKSTNKENRTVNL